MAWLMAIMILALTLGCGSGDAQLFITGEVDSADSKILIDGKAMGVMLARRTPVTGSDGKRLQDYTIAKLSIPRGKHKIQVVRGDGKDVSAEFEARHETYLIVDFANDRIVGDLSQKRAKDDGIPASTSAGKSVSRQYRCSDPDIPADVESCNAGNRMEFSRNRIRD